MGEGRVPAPGRWSGARRAGWGMVLILLAGLAVPMVPADASEEAMRYVVGFDALPEGLGPGDAWNGGTVVRVNEVLRFAVVEVPDPAAFEGAAAWDASVRYAEQDREVVLIDVVPDDPRFNDQYGPQQVEAPEAWDTTLGDTDRNVCIVDTGVRYTHEDLTGPRWLGGYDFINGDADPWDDNGHGTHVAGTAAATTDNGKGVAGVAQVGIKAAKVLSAGGSGTFSQVADGIEWCADNEGHVISMSLGASSGSAVIEDAVNYAWNKGMLLVAAAGNSGPCGDCIGYPAKYAKVMAITCTTSSEAQCSFSSDGPQSSLAAPGSGIINTYVNSDTSYASLSGTSMSTPHVSGVAALVWSYWPQLSNEALREVLEASARDVGPGGWDEQFGHGIVDARKTLDNLRLPSQPRDLTAAADPDQVDLTWAAPEDPGGLPISNYRVYRMAGADPEALLVELGNVMAYTDNAVQPGTTYAYHVAAKSLLGEGPRSNAARATVTLLPQVAFTFAPAQPRPGEQVAFTDASTDPDGTVVAWSWTFGDGATSAAQSPTHTYADDGSYTARLEVTDDAGAKASLSKVVVVNEPPTAAFSFAPSNPKTATPVTFIDDSSDPDGSIVSYAWDFGDGATSTERNPSHPFSDDGIFPVTLRVTDEDGGKGSVTHDVVVLNRPPTVDFAFTPAEPYTSDTVQFEDLSTDPDGTVAAWSWDFGDGTGSTAPKPGHRYADNGIFIVKLTATDDDGDSATRTRKVTVLNVGPSPAFTTTPSEPRTKDTVQFTDTSTDSDGSVQAWSWDFGDGATSTAAGPGHRYPQRGTYTVTLEVTDDDGASAATSRDIVVLNTPPEAGFTHTPQEPTDLEAVRFTDTSTDSDGSVQAWDWDFGDGAASDAQHPSHNYEDDGVYTVTLTVTDNDGDTATRSADIVVLNVAPTPGFSHDPDEPVAHKTAQFTDTSTDPDGSVVAWAWDFGDGSSSVEQHPTHTFAHDGTFTVQLTATDDDGDSATASMQVKVIDVPDAPRNLDADLGPFLGDISLEWDPPANDHGAPVQRYLVYRGTAAGSLALYADAGAATEFTDHEAGLGTTYYYAVSAVNKAGEGPRSAEAHELGTGAWARLVPHGLPG